VRVARSAADKPWQGDLFAHALDRRPGRDRPTPGVADRARRQHEPAPPRGRRSGRPARPGHRPTPA
jgi:hypothetical protein